MPPKVFISYSWTTQQHQEMVKEWADRLLADKVDVLLDIYDLKEGQDKNAFMEKMVSDKEVTHVLVICDKGYTEKANTRKRGVGTESQIISQEVYEQVDQSKFIPIITEFSTDENPFVPTFLKSRLWINFSSPEAVNENWERLIRLLYGKPIYVKPKLGKTPAFLEENSTPPSPVRAKYQSLKQAILSAKPGVSIYRKEFLETCIEYIEDLRIRERPLVDDIGQKVLEDCSKLVVVRDHIIDWILLEAEAAPSEEFSEALIDFLEQLRALKIRTQGVNQWDIVWPEVHALFVFEVFLYIVAGLVRVKAFTCLHNVFTSHYIRPAADFYDRNRFDRFDVFYAYSDRLQSALSREGRRLYSPAAALLQRHANRADLPFIELIQADLIVLLIAFINPGIRWYPQLMHYANYSAIFPFFARASQHKNFSKLSSITGVDNAEVLRKKVKEGHERLNILNWHDFYDSNFWNAMNMDNLDTIQ